MNGNCNLTLASNHVTSLKFDSVHFNTYRKSQITLPRSCALNFWAPEFLNGILKERESAAQNLLALSRSYWFCTVRLIPILVMCGQLYAHIVEDLILIIAHLHIPFV